MKDMESMKSVGSRQRANPAGIAILVAALAAFLLALAYFLQSTLPIPQQGLYDLNAYLRAGDAVLEGGNMYEQIMPVFQYPPAVGLAFAPLAALDLPTANSLWFGLNLALIIATCAGIVFIVGAARGLAFWTEWAILLCIAFAVLPTWTNLKLGQISGFTFAIFILALVLHKMDRPHLAGIALGIAASVKLIPLVFVVHALWKRDFRYGISALLTFALIQAAPLAIYPDYVYHFWFERMPGISDNETSVNISLGNLFYVWSMGGTTLVTIGRVIGMAAIGVPFLLFVRQRGVALIEVALLVTATAIFGPVVQNNHLVWMILPAWIALRCLFEIRYVPGLIIVAFVGLLYSQPFRLARLMAPYTTIDNLPETLQGGTLLTIGTVIGYAVLLGLALTMPARKQQGPVVKSVISPLSPAIAQSRLDYRTQSSVADGLERTSTSKPSRSPEDWVSEA